MARVTALKNPKTVSALDGYDPGDFHCELLSRLYELDQRISNVILSSH